MARSARSPSDDKSLTRPNRSTRAEDLVDGPVLSDLDRALIDSLRRDGRQGNRALASQLNVNEVTVAARLRRLEEADVMRVVAVTDIRLFGHREFTFAMLQVSGRPVYDVAADLAKFPEAVGVTITTGRFDIIAPLLCRDRSHVAELFGAVLPAIDGVDAVRGTIGLDVLKYDSKWALFRVDPGTTPEAQSSETVDDMDLEIIGLLQRNARRSNRSIAADLGVSEGTVRGRIKRMLTDRVFRIQAVSDVVAFGFGAHAYVGIKTAPGAVEEVAAALVQRDDVSQLTRVLDGFDLVGVLIARDHDSLVSAVFDEIALLPGVRRAETFYGCGSLKHAYAWTWIV